MSDVNSEQHGEYHRGNRARLRGRRSFWPTGNNARGQFHQTGVAEDTAKGAEDEFDLASEDDNRDRSGNQRGHGRGAHWSRGYHATFRFQQPWVAEDTARGAADEFGASEDGNEDQSGNQRGHGRGARLPRGHARGQFHQTGVGENTARGAEDEFDLASEDGSGDQSGNQRGQGRKKPRSREGSRGRGRGEGVTTSSRQPSFAGESFVEQTDDNEEYSLAGQVKAAFEQNTRRSEHRPSSTASKTEQWTEAPAPNRSVRVDQNIILHYLINSHDGSCLVSDLRENHELFEASLTPNAVLGALKHCKNVKVLRNENNLDGSFVRAFIKSLRLCLQHRPPRPCTRNNCHHLHLCRDFVMDCCFMKHCVCSHDVDSQQNALIMNDCGVHIFSPDQRLSLVRCANLMVCREHNSSEGCPHPESCFKLHVCNAYVMKKCCLLDDRCDEGHDPFSRRNRKVLQLYEMENLPKETIFKMLLAFRRQPLCNRKYAGNCFEAKEFKPANIQRRPGVEHEENETETNVTYEAVTAGSLAPQDPHLVSFTDFVRRNADPSVLCDVESKDICDTFEEHSCNLQENCANRHKSRTPYLWRVKLKGQWISLDKENSAIENAFSNPDVEEYWAAESIPVRHKFQEHENYFIMEEASKPEGIHYMAQTVTEIYSKAIILFSIR